MSSLMGQTSHRWDASQLGAGVRESQGAETKARRTVSDRNGQTNGIKNDLSSVQMERQASRPGGLVFSMALVWQAEGQRSAGGERNKNIRSRTYTDSDHFRTDRVASTLDRASPATFHTYHHNE